MTSTVDTLEAIFANNECKLNVIMCKLEECFSKFELKESSRATDKPRMNPIKIITELKQIQDDLQQTRMLYKEIKDTKNEMNDKLKTESESLKEEIDTFLNSCHA